MLTRDKVFWSRVTDSHTETCEEYGLHEDGAHGPNVLKVEIVPRRATITDFYDFDQWDYRIDQDVLPEWHDAPADRERAFAALRELVRVRVYASYCQNLTRLTAPSATRVYASGCPKLTRLSAPAATSVDAYNCRNLTQLEAPSATYVYASDCPKLTRLSVAPGATVYR